MWYIRFLRPPQVVVQPSVLIEIIITVTTDLGDRFYPSDVSLHASVRSESNNIIIKENLIKWRAGSRCVKSSFQLSAIESSEPVYVHLISDPTDVTFTNSSPGKIPAIHAISSATVDTVDGAAAVESVARRTFGFSRGSKVIIWEDIGDSIARHVWDAGVALSFHLQRIIDNEIGRQSPFTNLLQGNEKLQIVELGCGCGIVGIVSAHNRTNCRVILTDLLEASGLAVRNAGSASLHGSSGISFQALDWEMDVPDLPSDGPIDVILASDCTYNPDSSPALVRTLTALAGQSPQATVIIAMKVRHSAEIIFFDLMQSAGFVNRSHYSVVLPGIEADNDKVDIYYFNLRRNDENDCSY